MCPPSADAMGSTETLTDHQPPHDTMPPAMSCPPILIVDDDPIVRLLMQGMLEDEGFSVVAAEDGIEACRRCEEVVPSLIVADAVMPNMDGFELCRELRRQMTTRHVPILMATGLDDHASIASAYDAGATDFIAKPLNWLIFHHRIRYMLRGASTLKELRENQENLRVAQELEREQSERFEAALANMSQGLCMFGADGRLIVTNRRFRDIFRLAPASVEPGKSLIDVLTASPVFGGKAGAATDAALGQHLALASRCDSAALTLELLDGRVVTISHEPKPSRINRASTMLPDEPAAASM